MSEKESANNSLSEFFKDPISLILCGVFLPLTCLVLFPVIIPSDLFGPHQKAFFPGNVRTFAYVMIIASTLTSVIWVSFCSFPSVCAGIMFAASLFALAVGTCLLPLSIIGLLFGIGILGFSPFVVAFVFCWHARIAYQTSTRRYRLIVTLFSFMMMFAVPYAAQTYVNHVYQRYLSVLHSSDETLIRMTSRKICFLGPLLDTNVMITEYQNTSDEQYQKNLGYAYHELTGEDLQKVIWFIEDD